MTEHQVIAILKEVEADFPLKIFGKYGMGNSTFINGRKNTIAWKCSISSI
ncbi:hypothetical protein [Snodgrassella communis]|nr:hypothetical protein [Snodgrassella communis]